MAYREITLDYYGGKKDDFYLYLKFQNNLNEENGNNASGIGTYSFGTDRNGVANNCLSLTNATITTGSNLQLSDTDKLTVSFWIKTSQTSAGTIFNAGTNISTDNSFYANINYIGVGKILIQDRQSSVLRSLLFTNQTFNDNNWHHVVITNDRALSSVNQMNIYVDNVFYYLSVFEINDLNLNYTDDFPLTIGNSILGAYSGLIDDFKIYKRILTIAEITQLYNE